VAYFLAAGENTIKYPTSLGSGMFTIYLSL